MAQRPLIGTSLDQISTNGMLGDLAFQDSSGAYIDVLRGSTSLEKLSKEITDTAIDVFVYDTRKDSDGGAWRKRTQHTSWYNETLNTATRGSRRDFPSVAVIVATSNSVIIYDGDDPDMPMWMVFNRPTTTIATILWAWSNVVPTAIVALNGIISFATTGSSRFRTLNLISEVNYTWDSGQSSINFTPISNRDSSITSTAISGVVLTREYNDVAMTVLPNAPIDPATGLPVPTIAIATDGGASVIRDNGTIVNITFSDFNKVYKIGFIDNSKIYILNDDTSRRRFVHIYDIPNATITQATNGFRLGSALEFYQTENDGVSANLTAFNTSSFNADINDISIRNYGSSAGLIKIDSNTNSPSNGLVNITTTSYNTGWMHGDIRGAWLSDTSTTSITGTELINNGTFDSNINGWTAFNSTNAWSSGTMQITRSGGSGQSTYQSFTTVAGQRYIASAQINSSGSRGDLYINDGVGWAGTNLAMATGTSGQTLVVTAYFTAISTTTTIAFGIDNNGTSIFVDNVSVRIAEPDRSLNNKGLAVYGTITKTPVATGSNLIGYSGWSTSNYLQQPYNSGINVGTGDFSITGWMNDAASSGSQTFVYWGIDGETGGRLLLSSTGTVFNFYAVTAGWAGEATAPTIRGRGWAHVCCIRTGTRTEIYVNGVRGTTGTAASDLSNSSAILRVGYRTTTSGEPANSSSISLVRFSATVPSPEQIRKIYEDEKTLFQPNSQCTLFGSSNAVTALAYDDTTNLLHVGTSSGRSDFRGLERINNTTTAVTTAISASNGLVAEQ